MEQGLEGGLVSVYPSTFLLTSPQSMSDRAITDQEEATVQKQLSIRLRGHPSVLTVFNTP